MINIVFIRFSSLGDIILTTPVINRVKEMIPNSNIVFVTKKKFSDILEYNSNIDKIITLEKQLLKELSYKVVDFFLEKEHSQIDYIFDLHNKIRSKLLIRQLKLLQKKKFNQLNKEKIKTIKSYSFKKPYFKRWMAVYFHKNLFSSIQPVPEQYISSFYDDIIKNFPEQKIIKKEVYPFDNKYKLKKPILFKDQNFIEKNVHPPNEILKDFLSLKQTDTIKIAIAGGATWFTKKWPSQYFIDLCFQLNSSNEIPKNKKIEFVFLGGKDEMELSNFIEEKFQEQLKSNDNKIIYQNFIGKTNLFETSAILSNCDYLITNDSGLMHMASAFNVYIFALFLSTIPEFGYIPFTNSAEVLSLDLACKPCDHKGRKSCPKKHFHCAKLLTVDIVYNKVIQKIKEG